MDREIRRKEIDERRAQSVVDTKVHKATFGWILVMVAANAMREAFGDLGIKIIPAVIVILLTLVGIAQGFRYVWRNRL